MEILNGIAFNPQPTARRSLFCTHVVLNNATIHTCLDLSSINAKSIAAEKGSRHGCLQSITSTSMTKSDARHERQCRPSTRQQGFYFETDLRGLRSNILLGSTQLLRKKPKR
jgi:hypothetical protein